MKYIELAEKINQMTDEQKEMDVSIYVSDQDEYIPLKSVTLTKETDVLDEGHPVLNTWV